MPCCEHHNHMDRLLSSTVFNDFTCGSPTNPTGESRYCCRQCPSIHAPFQVKPEWAANPKLMSYLSEDERREVLQQALLLGSQKIDIQTSIPLPLKNTNIPTEP